ncbi:unnamed protein product [Acanthoscelides obtectus]|uniref:Uncharacterized protein n=1 Tax=Acanthoscelides obtectus TaxID=200917 RepID=A0A9P0L736_ACAOB|nr:unnamed protein product [Acanthoscelides obtectus]CAK1656814.1 hypothetical protein AOBTE_LOCUS19929 [Acanthoscelides obtectus]
MTQTEYKRRHDEVGKTIHQKLALKYGLIGEKRRYYQYQPETVLENTKYEVYWDRSILTDKSLGHNRPDITIWKKKEGEVLLIDIAVTNDTNMGKTFAEKINKYIDLNYELKDLWRVDRVKMIPIVLSNMGTIPRNLFKSVEELDLEPYIHQQMQKAVILNTCHIAQRFLYSE